MPVKTNFGKDQIWSVDSDSGQPLYVELNKLLMRDNYHQVN